MSLLDALSNKPVRISELSKRTGISTKLIHYYLKKGYLHPPVFKRGNQAFYDHTHSERINLLLQCKKRGVPLVYACELWEEGNLSRETIRKQTFPVNDSQTRLQIIDTATQVFLHKGYQQTSISEIVNNIGITKSAFYYYFKNKKDIYFTCISIICETFSQKTFQQIEEEKNPVRRLLMRAHSLTQHTDEKINIIQLLKESLWNEDDDLKNKASNILLHYWINPLKEDLQCCINNNMIRPVNIDITSLGLLSLFESFSYHSLIKNNYPNEEIANCLVDLVTYGLLK